MNTDSFSRPDLSAQAPRQHGARPAARCGGLAKVVQGVLIHEHGALVRCQLSPEQHAEARMCSVEKMLDSIARHDSRPLAEARPPRSATSASAGPSRS